MKFKSSFSLVSLPMDKVFWFKIMKSIFKKMLWEGGLKLLVIGLSIAYASFAVFCHNCMQQGRV